MINDNLDDGDATIVSLVENVHRAEMHPIDKARAYKQIYARYGTYADVARQANVSPGTVSRYIKLLDLAPDIQDELLTSDGVVGVEALSTLAKSFHVADQEEARDLIGGFRADLQIRILRESGGNLERLVELREKALSGVFDLEPCLEEFKQGREEGMHEQQERWLQWLERQRRAGTSGLPFNEPPPDLNTEPPTQE